MSLPFTTLGELRVARTLEEDAVLPLVEAVHPDGRVLLARVLPLSSELSSDAVARFEASVGAASSIAHPCVATPRAWSVSPAFVAVDAVEGASLAAIASAPMSADRVVAIGADVAEALEAVHAAGAVHAGVSLRAVTIAREGRAVLGELAIAGLGASLANAHSHVLEAMSAQLTPEQLESAPTTPATDVFSLGVTLYRLLTGRSPFDASSPLGMTLKLSMGAYERLDVAVPGAPAPLRDLVHRMLASAPNDRPSARDVAIALIDLAPREASRRETLRALLPAEAMPAVAPPAPAAEEATPLAAPAPSLSPVSSAATVDVASPPPAPSPAGPTAWVESARFDDAATEFAPELEAAIARDAGISNMPILEPSRRSAPHAPPRVSVPAPERGAPSPLLYVSIAAVALFVLVAAVLTAIALVD